MDKNTVNAAGSYPLSKERLEEIFGDIWGLSCRIGALCGGGPCVVGGCRQAKDAGWVVWDGELLEVEASSAVGTLPYLVRKADREIAVVNSEGEQVVVRQERRCEWSAAAGNGGVRFSDLKRFVPRTALPDTVRDQAVGDYQKWGSGTAFQARRIGGRVHLWGSGTWGTPPQNSGGDTIEAGSAVTPTSASAYDMGLFISTLFAPADGTVALPMHIGGKPAVGLLSTEGGATGYLLAEFPEAVAAGTVVSVDFWYDSV